MRLPSTIKSSFMHVVEILTCMHKKLKSAAFLNLRTCTMQLSLEILNIGHQKRSRKPPEAILEVVYVTGFGKTLRVRFFLKIEFYVRLISPTIELTHVQVPDQSCTLLWSYRALFAIVPHPQ